MILKAEVEALGVHPPGGGNGSGRGPTPPNIDEIIKNIQKTINRFLPGKVEQKVANL